MSKRTTESELTLTLGTGMCTTSTWEMMSVLVPLYAVAVGLNATQIGLIVAARSVLPTLLSIHGGILVDQLGTRRMLLISAPGIALLPLLYPVSPWFPLLTFLQLLLGFASASAIGASQTRALTISRGDTAMLGRYSMATSIGTFVGPVLVGTVWDYFGAWAGFVCVTLCGVVVVAMARAMVPPSSAPIRIRSLLLPRWHAHKDALRLATIPAVAFVLTANFLRNATGAIQNSLFVAYLSSSGLSGTLIGALVAGTQLFAVAGSLVAAPAQRMLGSTRLVILCITVAVGCICATPLLADILVLLAAACALRGIAQGMSQPLMYSMLSHEVDSSQHGVTVGLRNAVVRLGSMVTPAAMGLLAQASTIEASFYLIGIVLLLITAGLAVASRKIAWA